MRIVLTTQGRKAVGTSALVFFLLAITFVSGGAQGFVRKYTGDGGFFYRCDLQARSNGYTLAVNNWAYGGTRFRVLETDWAGVAWADTTLDFAGTEQKCWWVSDGSFLCVEMTDGDSIGFKKTTPSGADFWSVRYDIPNYQQEEISTITQTNAGNYYISGVLFIEPVPTTNRRLFLIKLDGLGNLLWLKTWDPISGSEYFESERFVVHPNEAISLCVSRASPNEEETSARVMHVDAEGNEIWQTPVGRYWNTIFGGLALSEADHIGVPTFNGGTWEGHFMVLDAQGDTIVNQPLQPYFPSNVISINTRSVFAYPGNGGWLLTGIYRTNTQPETTGLFLVRLEPDGALKWLRTPNPFGWELPYVGSAVMATDGSAVLAGVVHSSGTDQPDRLPFMMKIDSMGRIFGHSLEGRVFFDSDFDCAESAGEMPISNWVVALHGQMQQPLYALSGPDGGFLYTDVDTGAYSLVVHTPNSYWFACDSSQLIYVPDSVEVVGSESPVQPIADCPFMTVDLSTPFLRRCFPNIYSVHYCNNGSVADSAFVQVILDPRLDFDNASIPHVQNGDTLWFALGLVGILQCGDFFFSITVNCDSTALGETICVNAHIFPDSLCNPLSDWTGATLVGSAVCTGDSVHFTLRNIGIAPSTPALDFIIVDDHVIMFQQPLPALPAGGLEQFSVPANGQTWRFMAEQEPNHPGKESISVGVEGCNSPVHPGHLLQFANTDGHPFTATDCQEVIASYDPNEKNAMPRGVGTDHFIAPEIALTYRILFQNTGTDTAFTVVLRDTLSSWLDPATWRPGASSHPYLVELSGAGVLEFIFPDIMLPDSNTNETASHGFVQFSISQRPGTPLGTVVENSAGIYFDFNPVVLTNTVWHTVDTGFLKQQYVALHEPETNAPLALRAFPNPATTTVRVELPLKQVESGHLRMFDLAGKVIWEKAVYGPVLNLRRESLPPGIYFLEWFNADRTFRGKLLFR